MAGTQINRALKISIGAYEKALLAELRYVTNISLIERLRQKDATLWTGKDESQWLGWLDVVETQLAEVQLLTSFAHEVVANNFKHVLVLGMGGSSLAAYVIEQIFRDTQAKRGYPAMLVLDSIIPADVKAVRSKVDLSCTLCIVASKSGSTIEPNMLCQYFYEEARSKLGSKAGDNFIVITDPGSSLTKVAAQLNFSKVFYGDPAIGGRFSALSNFGMVPAAAVGVDIANLLAVAKNMILSCTSCKLTDNSAAVLGTIIAVLARSGRDKLTIITSPVLNSFGAWLEQLIAESTGKEGKGIIPIVGEMLDKPETYGNDRFFVYIRLDTKYDTTQDKTVAALEASGQPVLCLNMHDTYELGAEFFRWEFAIAVAGAILGINPFDQPNVQESKAYTKLYLQKYPGKPEQDLGEILLLKEDSLELWTDNANKEILEAFVEKHDTACSIAAYLAAHLAQLSPGDYFAINAYLERTDAIEDALQQIRTIVMKRWQVATMLGFGPSFLHSTGQLYKGGPNTGVFLQITYDDPEDLVIPAEEFSFGVLKEAQAKGDFLALSKRARRLLHVHLGKSVQSNLNQLVKTIAEASSQNNNR